MEKRRIAGLWIMSIIATLVIALNAQNQVLEERHREEVAQARKEVKDSRDLWYSQYVKAQDWQERVDHGELAGVDTVSVRGKTGVRFSVLKILWNTSDYNLPVCAMKEDDKVVWCGELTKHNVPPRK